MTRPFLPLILGLAALTATAAPVSAGRQPWQVLDAPEHDYWNRPLRDRFTAMKDDLASGKLPLDHSSETAFVTSLLKALDVPASSQLLVFSNTSLQLRLISPRNPRALYFSDDLYVGWVPGGKVEIISIDPDLGGIFYIFNIPRGDGAPLVVERSNQCMNCHDAEDTGFVPGISIRSVIPGTVGGSLVSYRAEETGHGIPFSERFGGWFVTGAHGIREHHGNVIGDLFQGNVTTTELPFGRDFRLARYPAATSDILPHLIHEHQAGFVNRAVAAGWRTRAALHHAAGAPLSAEVSADLDKHADTLTAYLLFADEAALPPGGVTGDPAFAADYAKPRKATADGLSLRDLELKTRLYKNRCSPMIYSAAFTGLPPEMKSRVFARLGAALDSDTESPPYPHLSRSERRVIRRIIEETLPDLPAGW